MAWIRSIHDGALQHGAVGSFFLRGRQTLLQSAASTTVERDAGLRLAVRGGVTLPEASTKTHTSWVCTPRSIASP
jgi:hypothetical protein